MADYSTWLNKQDAAEAIGVSTKTLEQMVRAGQIQQATWRRPKGMPIAVYEPSDVERVAHERNPSKPFVVGRVVPATGNGNGNGLAPAPTPRPDAEFLRGLAALRAAVDYTAAARGTTTLFLSLKDAAEASGLSQTYLRRAIADGKLPALKDRGWRIRRTDLERL